MIMIVDYKMGNVGSVKNMLHHIGEDDVVVSANLEDVRNADRYILPGVGAFDAGMRQLYSLGIVDELKKQVVENKKPLLGICLGMQLLGRKSDEGDLAIEGLNLIPFDVKKFDNTELKVPHMGWDYVTIIQKNDRLINELLLDEPQRYYFVHSFYASCDSVDNVLMECEYGIKFVAAVRKDNIYGVQFHPEKSHRFGMQMLRNFADL